MTEITTKEYCNWLRELGAKLASGEIEEYRLDLLDLAQKLNGDDYHKVTKSISYSRTIINRVPDVKSVGSISIKVEEDDFAKYYIFTLNRDAKRRVITSEELPEIKAKAILRFADKLLNLMPNVMHLEGERQAGALEGIKLYQEMIAKFIKEENQ